MTLHHAVFQPDTQERDLDVRKAAFIIALVGMVMGIPMRDIASERRNHAPAARARQTAMYLACVTYQWPMSRIARAFDRDRTTVGYACRLIEDLRDDPGFDTMIEALEGCLRAAPEPKAGRRLIDA